MITAVISDPFVLATELKRAVKGTVAENRIKSVSVTRPEAYDFMWKKLNAYYDNTGAIVSEALEALSLLQPGLRIRTELTRIRIRPMKKNPESDSKKTDSDKNGF